MIYFQNSDRDIDEHINEEKRNTDKYEVRLRNAQNKVFTLVKESQLKIHRNISAEILSV